MRITGKAGFARVVIEQRPPVELGIITSVMIRSGGASPMIFNAMWPSAAVCTHIASVHENRSHDVPDARLVVDD